MSAQQLIRFSTTIPAYPVKLSLMDVLTVQIMANAMSALALKFMITVIA